MTDQHAPAATVGAPDVDRRALGVGLCIGVVAIAFESISVATAMPRAAEDLGGLRYYAWAFTLFVIGMLTATVVAGRVADRVGPLRPLVTGMITFAVGLVVAGTAEVMLQLLLGRLIQGIGAGALNLGLFVMVARGFEERHRPTMMTWISTAWVVPAFIGPPVSAWITETFSWHWVFIGVLPLVLVAGALGLPAMLKLQRSGALDIIERSTPVPLWAGAVVALAAAGIQYAGQRAAVTVDLLTVAVAVVAVAALVVAVPRLMPPGFLRVSRGLSSVVWSRAVAAGAFFGAEAFVPLMLVQTRGLPLVLAGASLTVGAVGWTTGSWLQSRTWLPLRRDQLITSGSASLLLGLSATAVIAAVPSVWFGFVGVAWIFVGLGMGLMMSSSSVAMMTLSRSHEQGRNSSSLQVGEALGNAILAGGAGTIFAVLHSGALSATFGTVFAAMAAAALVGTLLTLRIGRITAPSS
ncbi:MFS transporter [Auraticoccus monumenti]|uniref:Predicted arabinose efflux permease, MFS family n=1 Tax=Auraticoccus monumenti TaxID=675864 RepID=A0A1G6ZA90_9ACTN|nr:MFS transporter [Auraticoccus monumenti]SDD99223.1 Predicted arabinose efflux permease, MFS family [Auraticoccus monumenti]